MNKNDILLYIRDIVNGKDTEIDMTEFLYKHNCIYLLSQYSNKYSNNIYYEKLKNTISVLERFKALKDFFDSDIIPYAVIKGAPLSQTLYESPFIRSSGDIDILVNINDVDLIKSYLLSKGFIQGRIIKKDIQPFTRKQLVFQSTMSHQIAPFVIKTQNILCPFINVDINTDIIWGENSLQTDMEYVLSNVSHSSINNVSFNKLSVEMEFISLCLHHYKDMNSIYLLYKRGLKLVLFYDIFLFLRNSDMNENLLLLHSERLGVGKYLYYCVYYTNLIFNDNTTNFYKLLLRKYEDCEIMDCFGLSKDERKRWKVSFYERLFSNNFSLLFADHLTDIDIKKIKINDNNM